MRDDCSVKRSCRRSLGGAAARALGALLLAGTAALTAQSALAASQVRFVAAEYSAATKPYFEEVIKDFEAKHPDIDIQLEVVSWDNLQQRLTTDIAGGTAPDVSLIGTRWLVDFVKQDIAEPLDARLTPEFKGRFIESFMTPSTIDGQVWALPIAASARALYYNKSLLAKAGVNEPPATWDALVEAARKVKAQGEGAYGFALQGKEIETDAYFYYALWTQGGNLLEDGKSGIASEAGIKAATLYKSMIDEGLTEPDPTGLNRQDIEKLFKTGRAAMLLSGPWLRGQIKTEAPDLDYGLALIPEGTTKATYGVTDSVMVFKDSENKEAAWTFLNEVFSPQWRKEFSKREGFLPVTHAEAEDPYFKDDQQLQAFTGLLPYAKFAPLIPNWEQMADVTSGALQNIYLGKTAPDAALKDAATRIDALLEQ